MSLWPPGFKRQFEMITDAHHSSLNCERIAVNSVLRLIKDHFKTPILELAFPASSYQWMFHYVLRDSQNNCHKPFQFQHKSLMNTQSSTDSRQSQCQTSVLIEAGRGPYSMS